VGQMKHAARRASSVVVLLLLIASVGPVSAQSTWGLWERSGTSWRRLGTFNAESECRTSALRGARSLYNVQSRRSQVHPGTVELHGTEVHIPADFGPWVISFECFADTVDLQGPRRK